MVQLPHQITGLYFILTLVVAAVLLAVVLKKSKSLDSLKTQFSQRELLLNKKLYETAVLKNKLEAMVERMTEGVFMLDKDFKLLVANPACRELLGLSKTKKLTIFDLVRSFNQQYPIEETISQVFESGEAHRVSEVKVGDKFLQITVLPVEVAEGVPGVGVLLHDQTEEQNLRHKHEEFMAMMAHELRSPLTVIKGMADMLLKNHSKFDDSKLEESLTQMETSTDELLEMINTLLKDTKEDSTKFEIHSEEGDINEVIMKEIKNYEGLARERGLDLSSELDTEAPLFSFDPAKITQVLNNLISNSIKFTHEGGIIIKSIKQGRHSVKVEIIDTGEGVPDDMKPKLFQKFVQLHEDEDPDLPGTGLGLVISKGIIEAHGGKIWIENNKPQGTKFIFTLPLSG
ncbi:PAS domain-containing sensor histidine kinase [candidate division WWE3 bacterium]|jgi:signal transduction histidine kinase|nr:PAS domain-containing sensor histidine kinase [candidate division WWE3 bacterium]MBT7349437.1 PAS domain-containing sensor histidine kinase [candidate division WWE3 bacterium]